MNEFWDIAVVGAGPSGSLAARQLARAGRQVVLFDKANFPRSKVCGCCLNGLALSSLQAAGLGDLPARLGAVRLHSVQIAANGRAVNLHLPNGMALSRETMDAALVREAEAAGAEVRTGAKVKLGELRPDGWTLVTGQETIRAKLVIDATGLNGQLRNTDTMVSVQSRIGAGTLLDARKTYPAGTIHMATGGGGYVGLVCVEDGRLDVAAAFDPQYLKSAGGLGRAAERVVNISGLPPLPDLLHANWKGTPPLTRTARSVAGPRWFAIGDATGYVEPFTGEGMAWAFAAAVAVVPIVDRAVNGWTEGHAHEWMALHRRVVTRRQTVCRIAAKVLRSPRLSSWVVRTLTVYPVLATPVVKLLNQPLSGVN